MNPRAILFGSALTGLALLSLLDAAAKGVVLFLIAIALTLAMRRASAAGRHLVWLCAFCGALALPFCAALLPQWRVLPDWMRWEEIPRRLARAAPAVFPAMGEMRALRFQSGMPGELDAASPARSADAQIPAASSAKPLRVNAATVLAAWACGASLLLGPLLYSFGALARISRRARIVTDGPLATACTGIERELGLRRRIRLLLGAPDAMPMVWGIFRARLLLPAEAETWPAARLRAVLLHELAHLRRHDPLALLIAHLALALHWFNPLAWFAVRQLRAEQERAADDLVLRHGVRASDYAGDLLAVSHGLRVVSFATAALTMAHPARLEGRIAGILDAARNRRALTRWLALAAALAAAAIALPLAMLRADETAKTRGRLLDRNGVVLAENKDAKTRRYPFGALAAHTLGYPGRDGKDGPLVGRSGAEKVFEARLGKGEDVRLTLDARLQSGVEKILRAADIGRGAVVILDPASGDLLASASVPNFDGNDFTPALSQEQWKALNDNRASPLLNRPLEASAPGSIYKLVTALAAVRTGKTDRIFQCAGGVTYGSRLLKCWIASRGGTHGSLNLHDALTKSCNCYFYQLGNEVRIEELEKTARLLGLGALSGLGLPGEKPGVIGSPALLRESDPQVRWSDGYTANAAIGQGYTLATPLQMASLAATLANNGRVLVPRLVADGPPQFRHDFAGDGKAGDLALLRAAMRDTVMLDGGTGKPARSEIVAIAGKTGSAQMWRTEGGEQVQENHAWFIGYAPADAPRYAFAISIEGGKSGGGICAPIARRIMEAVTAGLPAPEAQPPIAGHFDPVEEISFGKESAASDGEAPPVVDHENLSPNMSPGGPSKIVSVTTTADAAEIVAATRQGNLAFVVGEGEKARVIVHQFGKSAAPISFRAGAGDRRGKWWDQVRIVRAGEADALFPMLPDDWLPNGRIVFSPTPAQSDDGSFLIAEIESASGKTPLLVRGANSTEQNKAEEQHLPRTSPDTTIAIEAWIYPVKKDAPEKNTILPVQAAQDLVGPPRGALANPSLSVNSGRETSWGSGMERSEKMKISATATPQGIRLEGSISVPVLAGKHASVTEAFRRNETDSDDATPLKELSTTFSATLGRNDALVIPIASEGLFPETLVSCLTALPRPLPRERWLPPASRAPIQLDGWVLTWPRAEHEWFTSLYDYKDGDPAMISHHLKRRKNTTANYVSSEWVGFMGDAELKALLEKFRDHAGVKVERIEPFSAPQHDPPIPNDENWTHFVAAGEPARIMVRTNGYSISPTCFWKAPVLKHLSSAPSIGLKSGTSFSVLLPGPAEPEEIRMMILRCVNPDVN